MVAVGGPAPFVILFLVVDPEDYSGARDFPFQPVQAPAYWSLRKTPQDAIRRWSWSRANAYEALQRAYLLTYKLTAHGVGCACLGNSILINASWGRDNTLVGVRLRSTTLENLYLCDDQPMIEAQSKQLLMSVIGNAYDYIEIN